MTNSGAWAGHCGLEAEYWRKSSFSGVNECVVVAEVGQRVAVRNSNAPGAGTLLFTRSQMAAWIDGCKATEFDDLMM
jgi:hypothetical protein